MSAGIIINKKMLRDERWTMSGEVWGEKTRTSDVTIGTSSSRTEDGKTKYLDSSEKNDICYTPLQLEIKSKNDFYFRNKWSFPARCRQAGSLPSHPPPFLAPHSTCWADQTFNEISGITAIKN